MRWFFAGLLFLGAVAIAAVPSEAAGPHEILITSTAYDPSPLTITLGEAVYWCNDDTASHSVVLDGGGPDSGELEHDDCTEDLILSETGTYTYHDGFSSLTGSIVVEEPPTTTTAAPTTTVASATTAAPTVTTRRVTTTTRRKTTTTAAFKKSPTRELTTTTAESTTTTDPFATSSTEFTTTTFGSFAINETSNDSGNDRTFTAVLFGLVVLGGAGYLGYRYRYRFMR